MSDTDVEEEIQYPSGKLSALTRSLNKYEKSLIDGSSAERIQELKGIVLAKYDTWDQACQVELAKNVTGGEINDFIAWRLDKEKRYKLKMGEMNNSQNDGEDDYDDEGDDYEDAESPNDANGNDSSTNEARPPSEDTRSLLKEIVRYQATSRLPCHEPRVFDGDVADFRTFMLSFNRIIERVCDNDDDKYFYLLKYTKGEAHDLVNSCFSKNLTKSFERAKLTLENQYGNQYKLAQLILDKIMNWKPIRNENPAELKAFSSYLTSCYNMMDGMTSLNQLNSLRDIREIMMVLPYELRKSFRSMGQKRISNGHNVVFKDIVDFVRREAETASIPVLGNIQDNRNRGSLRGSDRSFLAGEPSFQQEKMVPFCGYCKKQRHTINVCNLFLEKTLPKRVDIVKSLNLCYGCLSSGHQSRNCRNRLECSKCRGNHPTCLHREPDQRNSDIATLDSLNDD